MKNNGKTGNKQKITTAKTTAATASNVLPCLAVEEAEIWKQHKYTLWRNSHPPMHMTDTAEIELALRKFQLHMRSALRV